MQIANLMPILLASITILIAILAMPILSMIIMSSMGALATGAENLASFASDTTSTMLSGLGNVSERLVDVTSQGLESAHGLVASGAKTYMSILSTNWTSWTGAAAAIAVALESCIASGIDALGQVGQNIMSLISSGVSMITTTITPLLTTFMFNGMAIATKIFSVFATPIKVFMTAVKNIHEVLDGGIKIALEAISTVISAMGDKLEDVLDLTKKVLDKLAGVVETGFEAYTKVLDVGVGVVEDGFGVVKDGFGEISGVVKTGLGVVEDASGVAKGIVKDTVVKVESLFSTLNDEILGKLTGFLESLIGVLGEIKTPIGLIGNGIGSIAGVFGGRSIGRFITDVVIDNFSQLQSTLTSFIRSLISNYGCGWIGLKIAGVSVCHLDSNYILVDNDGSSEWILIKDLKIGDNVITHTGSKEKVTYIINMDDSKAKIYKGSTLSHPRYVDGKLYAYDINQSFAYLQCIKDEADITFELFDKCNLITIETEGPSHTYSCKYEDDTIIYRDLSPHFDKNLITQLILYKLLTEHSETVSNLDTDEECKTYISNISTQVSSYIDTENLKTADIINITKAFYDATNNNPNVKDVFKMRYMGDTTYKMFHILYNIFYLYEGYISFESFINIQFGGDVGNANSEAFEYVEEQLEQSEQLEQLEQLELDL